jgi:TolA-binding protein
VVSRPTEVLHGDLRHRADNGHLGVPTKHEWLSTVHLLLEKRQGELQKQIHQAQNNLAACIGGSEDLQKQIQMLATEKNELQQKVGMATAACLEALPEPPLEPKVGRLSGGGSQQLRGERKEGRGRGGIGQRSGSGITGCT